MRVYKIILITISLSLIVGFSCLAESHKLVIIFSGDMRGEIENCHCPKNDFGGLNRRYKYISSIREKGIDILLVDTGDVLPLKTPEIKEEDLAYNAKISFKAMSEMGYDGMCVGETDLMLGEDFLISQEGENISFPLISGNIVTKDTGRQFFKPYIIKTMKDGLRVGIVGLLNERYVINSDNLEILPHKEMIKSIISEVKSKSDIMIVLGHIGLPYAMNLAESIEGIDVILSGHWTVEDQEPIEVKDTIIMSTVYHSRKIGRLDVEVDGQGIRSYTWESIPLDASYDGHKLVEDIISKMPKPGEEIRDKKNIDEAEIEQRASERPLRVMVFYSSGCKACLEIEDKTLADVEKKYGDTITIERYDVGLPSNYEQMVRLERLYGIEDGGYVPEIVVGREVLKGKKEIISRLDEVIHDCLEENIAIKKNETLGLAEYNPPSTNSIILERFESFNILTILTAGFLDGINPCAFTTIVFFISFLAFVGYKRREIFLGGGAFILAIFITYLLIGIGMFRFLRALKGFGYIMEFINIIIAGIAFLFGILSFIDYLIFKKTHTSQDIILKLPQFIKNKIHFLIGTDFRISNTSPKKGLFRIMLIAFTVGFIISVLESFCTGQVYLPTLAFIFRIPGKKIPALLYLVFYNLAFIVPLLIVFLLGLFGVSSITFSKFMERRLGLVKLATAGLFFLLGTILLIFS